SICGVLAVRRRRNATIASNNRRFRCSGEMFPGEPPSVPAASYSGSSSRSPCACGPRNVRGSVTGTSDCRSASTNGAKGKSWSCSERCPARTSKSGSLPHCTLARRPALADARITTEKQDLAGSPGDLRQHALDHLQLGVALDQEG